MKRSALLALALSSVSTVVASTFAAPPLYYVHADTSSTIGQAYFLTLQLYGGVGSPNSAEAFGFTNAATWVGDDSAGTQSGTFKTGVLLTDATNGSTSFHASQNVFTDSFGFGIRFVGDGFEGRVPSTIYNGLGMFIASNHNTVLYENGEGFGVASDFYRENSSQTEMVVASDQRITVTRMTAATTALRSTSYTAGAAGNLSDASRWTNGVPDLRADATINSAVNLEMAMAVHNLTITAGGTIAPRTGGSMNISGSKLTNNGVYRQNGDLRFFFDAMIEGTGTLGVTRPIVAEGSLAIAAGQSVTMTNLNNSPDFGGGNITAATSLSNASTAVSVKASRTIFTAGTSFTNTGKISYDFPTSGTYGFARKIIAPTITNDGTITTQGGELHLTASTQLVNNGTIESTGDFIYLHSPSIVHNGVFKTGGAASQILLNPASEFTLQTITGSGRWEIGDALTLNGPLDAQTTGELKVDGVMIGSGGTPATQKFSASNLTGVGTLTSSGNAGFTLRILDGDRTKPFTGQLIGKINIEKSGTGTTIFTSANNNLNSTTLVTGGAILVNNDPSNALDYGLGYGTTTVREAGVLGGTGRLGGRVFIENGGTLSPGDSAVNDGVSTFRMFSTEFTNGGKLAIDLKGSSQGVGYDFVEAISANKIAGTLALKVSAAYDPVYGLQHRIMDVPGFYDGASPADTIFRNGVFATITGNVVSSQKWLAVTYDSSGVNVTAALPGDADLNGSVGFDDLVTLAQQYNIVTGQTWVDADFNGDGATNFDDLVTLAQHYNTSLPGTNTGIGSSDFAADWALAQSLVPEPASLFAIASMGSFVRRQRRVL